MFLKLCACVSFMFAFTESTTVLNVFDLIASPQGLALQSSFGIRPYFVETNTRVSQVHSFLSLDELSAFLTDINGVLVRIPIAQSYQPIMCLDNPTGLSITPGSSFAAHFNSAMILPPIGDRETFQLKASPFGIIDPTNDCYEGTVGFAEMAQDTIGFDVSVSLIAAGGQTFAGRNATILTGRRSQFGIDLHSENSIIPLEIYRQWEQEFLRIAGVEHSSALSDIDWTGFIHRLPTIQYNVHVSGDSETLAATIVMEPEDYVEVLSPVGARLKVSPGYFINRPRLGLSTLKHVGVFLDYMNSVIGFCEPI